MTTETSPTMPTPTAATSNWKWVGLYGVLTILGFLAAVTVLIATGHNAAGLFTQLAPLVPLLAGLAGLFKGQAVIQQQTNGNISTLMSELAHMRAALAASVPASAVDVSLPTGSTVTIPAISLPPAPPIVLPDTPSPLLADVPSVPAAAAVPAAAPAARTDYYSRPVE